MHALCITETELRTETRCPPLVEGTNMVQLHAQFVSKLAPGQSLETIARLDASNKEITEVRHDTSGFACWLRGCPVLFQGTQRFQ